MSAETWLTVDQAIELGLADAQDDTLTAVSTFRVDGDAQQARQAYAAAMSAANMVATTVTMLPVTGPVETTREKGTIVDHDVFIQDLTSRLGLPTDTDETKILAVIDEQLTRDSAEVKVKLDVPEGTVLMDENQLADLQAQAEKGAEAMRMLTDQRRDQILDTAERDGRIAPSSRAAFRKMLDTDEASTVELLNSLTPNKIPVAEVGYAHTDTHVDELSLDEQYKQFFPEGEQE